MMSDDVTLFQNDIIQGNSRPNFALHIFHEADRLIRKFYSYQVLYDNSEI